MSRRADFAARLSAGAPLAGMFQKFPAHQAVELLGQTGLDFAVLDAEHAPFDPSQIDMSILASHAVDLPLLVRVPRNAPDVMLSVLDMGASGVFVPHITSAEAARAAVAACRYAGGERGLSPSTRPDAMADATFTSTWPPPIARSSSSCRSKTLRRWTCWKRSPARPAPGGLFVGRPTWRPRWVWTGAIRGWTRRPGGSPGRRPGRDRGRRLSGRGVQGACVP